MSFSQQHHGQNDNYYNNISGVAFSNKILLILSTIGFASLGITIYFLILRHVNNDNNEDGEGNGQNNNALLQRNNYGENLDQSDVATLNRAQRRARAKFRMKKARRAAVAPAGGHAAGGGPDGEDAGDLIVDDAHDLVLDDNGEGDHADNLHHLSRKERQKAAKQMEKEERKLYAQEARLRREAEAKRKQLQVKSQGGSSSDHEDETNLKYATRETSELDIELLFPRRENENDSLSEYLFWESIVRNKKTDGSSSNQDNHLQDLQFNKMTIRNFIRNLQQCGSVSIMALADEFGISILEALEELDNLNQQFGVIGLHDGQGQFVYVSKAMIEKAIVVGNKSGIIVSPGFETFVKHESFV